MINKIINIKNFNDNYGYYELKENKYEGSFIEILNYKNNIKISIDRFSTIPFYFYVHKKNFYGSTSLQDLIDNKPNDFKITLNKESCLFFLKTNTFLNHQTPINEISRLPYGCTLNFNKNESRLEIKRYWNFSGTLNNNNFYDILEEVYLNFEMAMNKYTKFKNIGVNVSGGFDTRQILGYLINNKIKFNGYNYGPKESPDSIVAKKLSNYHKFKLIFKEWKNINFYKDNFNDGFNLTDGMLAFHHFHPFNILDEQKNEDTILYGHFLDFFSQGWKYEKKYENISSKEAKLVIEKDFNDIGHFSVLSPEEFSKIAKKGFRDSFVENLKKELNKIDFLPAEKMYDAMYFLHHGTRRLLPQVQAASQKVNYSIPGLNTVYFDVIWKIPGKIKKKNLIREFLLRKYYNNVCNIEIIRDFQTDYVGNVVGLNAYYKIMKILRNKKFGLMKPYYDFWGSEIYKYINKDIKTWINKEITENALLDYDFLDSDETKKYLDNNKVPFSSLGTFITLSNFIKRNF